MMRARFVALLLAASGCPADSVTADLKIVDRAVDRPVLTWKDSRPDHQPWPDVRAPDVRVDQRVDRTDTVPLAFCADGTPIFQCSTQKPYVCTAAKLLDQKCSKCGCPGNEQCVPATEACQPVTVVLSSTADASASSGNPTTNYGAEDTLGVISSGVMSYVGFDVSKIPAKAKIDKATLKLDQLVFLASASVLLNLIVDPWGELLITYQNAPQVLSTPQPTASISGTGDKNIDVTALIQAWVDSPTVLHGLRITATSGAVVFASRESGSNGPALTIVYR
jgi:hypothetical protein